MKKTLEPTVAYTYSITNLKTKESKVFDKSYEALNFIVNNGDNELGIPKDIGENLSKRRILKNTLLLRYPRLKEYFLIVIIETTTTLTIEETFTFDIV